MAETRSIIIQSNSTGKQEVDDLLEAGWTVVSVTSDNGPSYNDFIVVLEKN